VVSNIHLRVVNQRLETRIGGMFVSITRLHIRGWRYMPPFAVQALRSAVQAKSTPGNLGVALLADAHRTFWTRTIWADENAVRVFMRSGPHRHVMSKLPDWCSEAAVVHWVQDNAGAPSWDDARQRMQREGRPSMVNNPTPAHTNFQIAAPSVSRFGELILK
jgi:Domain of unknown function (DUF3291)